jgi:hypothetical protein
VNGTEIVFEGIEVDDQCRSIQLICRGSERFENRTFHVFIVLGGKVTKTYKRSAIRGNIAYLLTSVHMRLVHDYADDEVPGETTLDVI